MTYIEIKNLKETFDEGNSMVFKCGPIQGDVLYFDDFSCFVQVGSAEIEITLDEYKTNCFSITKSFKG